ncbi:MULTISPECIES: Fe-S cluster assembly protein IscX [Streptomyces]|uniref:Fe-S cluster assembly protein IscX n=1 Tax=Streptomyces hesseae TaxID=3075519 RepID=A0ABU2SII7_9ACTN|nr:Fe-S cluster assembly protein IscX [Streptomyces sp. DSM 40473]MDT0448456.1 Fe-S cluster assembly protein IscX [Streptomyces sp. DSM 40473]
MRWTDIEEIAAGLAEQHPTTRPVTTDLAQIQNWAAGLTGFSDDPTRCNARLLESIQLAWSDRTVTREDRAS